MKKVFALTVALMVVMSVAAIAGDEAAGKSMEGFITDSGCAMKDAERGSTNEACAKKCIEGGKAAVFVDAKEKKVWTIENQDSVKGHEGHNVTVTGHVNEEKGSIHIAELKMM